jgi:hypothetical protein
MTLSVRKSAMSTYFDGKYMAKEVYVNHQQLPGLYNTIRGGALTEMNHNATRGHWPRCEASGVEVNMVI